MPSKQPITLLDEIEQDIDHHTKWEGRDFSSAQIFLWIGIVASVAASLHAAGAFAIDNKLCGAVLAAIPGVVLIIDKTFKFAARASWHALYRASLKSLFRKLRNESAPINTVSAERSKLEFEMEKMFPPLDSGSLTGKKP